MQDCDGIAAAYRLEQSALDFARRLKQPRATMTDTAKSKPGQGLSLSRTLTFSVGTLPVSAVTIALFVYLPHYFESHLAVPLVVFGGAWALVRILDLGVDLPLGYVMDHTRTAFGRYRVWLIAGAPVLMLGTYMLFMAPKGIGASYVIAWLLVLYLGISILYLSHSAWAAGLAPEYDQRSRLFGTLAAVGVVATVIELFVPITAHASGLTDVQSFQAMGWLVILATPLAIGLAAARTPETIVANTKAHHFSSDLINCLVLLRKPELIRLLLSQMALTLGPGWMSTLYLFFFIQARGYTSQQATLMLVIYIVAGILGALATGRIATRFGKHRTLITTTTAFSVGLCFVMAVPRGSMLGAAPVMFWCGFMASGFDLMIRAMMADVGDEIRLEQGKERVSLLYAMLSLGAKVAAALAVVLSSFLLDRVGFNPLEGAANSHNAIIGLEWVFLAGPIVFVMLGGACIIGWRLDAQRHAEIRTALDARDAVFDEAPILETFPVRPAVAVLAAEPEVGAGSS
jgi:GPH family glycoside/pentoside/hexuronide:cation symporter